MFRSGRRLCSSAVVCSPKSTRASPERSRTSSSLASTPTRTGRDGSWSMAENRFARTAEKMAARQDARAAELAEHVRAFVLPRGDERALDVGTGAGALALALAPLVRSVVGVDRVPELLALARERAAALGNVEFVEADATALPFEDASFDLAGTLR